jgi:hypothetical protein
MPFQKGHPVYPRRTNLVAVEDSIERDPLPIQRFTVDMVDQWLIERINAAWPDRKWSERDLRGRIADLARSNDVLLITNGSAVLCAVRTPHLMAGVAEVHEVFAFSRSARPSPDGSGKWRIPDTDALAALVDLYRRAREWKTEMGAVGMVACKCSDLGASDIRRYSWRGTETLVAIH